MLRGRATTAVAASSMTTLPATAGAGLVGMVAAPVRVMRRLRPMCKLRHIPSLKPGQMMEQLTGVPVLRMPDDMRMRLGMEEARHQHKHFARPDLEEFGYGVRIEEDAERLTAAQGRFA